ncbi:Stage V sporulation protein AD (SpoVAD) [Candidatus Syntrophocurvum alkaliphilum]|uniref:Stage V sporulation protein AD (SpoVAD) n=1 Tax=Candidatus Syntrophocurvum alkaliphilum TaxID=2293317 RepID=A0A6I6DHF7_9FIRM|nr:stage V sporulation protein AD [Candidatus Syntrophocurvum alkaliphilum]QGU00223.1 Stage V sporulation protein AD (SpoVAD) [Candidatus Syntrophocurvum alkaliphilum]
MLTGYQSWVFDNKPIIKGAAAVGGPFEAKGNLADDFDILHDDIWLGQDSFEKAEKKLLEQACEKALDKAGVSKNDVQLFFSGDLMNQIISSSFTARTLAVPYIGVFGACSSSMLSLSLAATMVNCGAANYALAGTSSHNGAAEKQFRYPTEYGAQKPPTAQWSVTGAGAALVSQEGDGPKITTATIGKVVDMGISDPFNMGGAMAPAAVDTIQAHFRDLNRDHTYYDLIVTGDLGRVGFNIASDLLKKHKVELPDEKFNDCGLMIYRQDQPVFAGASGCACSATVTYGHLLKQMKKGKLKKILVVATGALLSPMSYQQKESIPCVAHAVAIEA